MILGALSTMIALAISFLTALILRHKSKAFLFESQNNEVRTFHKAKSFMVKGF